MIKNPDFYQKMARAQGYHSRAAYKLMQIDKKYSLLNGRKGIVELGASPGGWTAVIQERAPNAKLVACDLQKLSLQGNYVNICGDFRDPSTREKISQAIQPLPIDLILSDMSPNISGNRLRDQAGIYELSVVVLDYARECLLPQRGALLTKFFQGEEMSAFIRRMKECFREVRIIKPDASAAASAEVYILGEECMLK